jgi:hypothetical protein
MGPEFSFHAEYAVFLMIYVRDVLINFSNGLYWIPKSNYNSEGHGVFKTKDVGNGQG